MSDEREPSLGTVINRAIEMGLRSLSTMIPARVVKWTAAKQQADCQILVKQVTEGEDGSREVASWPVVPGVPVLFLGAGGFRLSCKIVASAQSGTTGVLLFSHRSLSKWLAGSGAEVDPEFDHEHALTDAVFVPGLMPFGAPWQHAPDYMTIGDDADANGRIAFKSGAIELGDGATKGVARKDDKAGGGTLQFEAIGSTAITQLNVTYTPGDGTSTQTVNLNVSGTGSLSVKEKITTASEHIKAVD